eukprot:747419-Hanusia_phi.AAC.11
MASTAPTLKKMYNDVVELKNSQKTDLDKMDNSLQAIYDDVSQCFMISEAKSDCCIKHGYKSADISQCGDHCIEVQEQNAEESQEETERETREKAKEDQELKEGF